MTGIPPRYGKTDYFEPCDTEKVYRFLKYKASTSAEVYKATKIPPAMLLKICKRLKKEKLLFIIAVIICPVTGRESQLLSCSDQVGKDLGNGYNADRDELEKIIAAMPKKTRRR